MTTQPPHDPNSQPDPQQCYQGQPGRYPVPGQGQQYGGQQSRKTKRGPIIAIAGVVLAVIVAGLAWFFLRDTGSGSEGQAAGSDVIRVSENPEVVSLEKDGAMDTIPVGETVIQYDQSDVWGINLSGEEQWRIEDASNHGFCAEGGRMRVDIMGQGYVGVICESRAMGTVRQNIRILDTAGEFHGEFTQVAQTGGVVTPEGHVLYCSDNHLRATESVDSMDEVWRRDVDMCVGYLKTVPGAFEYPIDHTGQVIVLDTSTGEPFPFVDEHVNTIKASGGSDIEVVETLTGDGRISLTWMPRRGSEQDGAGGVMLTTDGEVDFEHSSDDPTNILASDADYLIKQDRQSGDLIKETRGGDEVWRQSAMGDMCLDGFDSEYLWGRAGGCGQGTEGVMIRDAETGELLYSDDNGSAYSVGRTEHGFLLITDRLVTGMNGVEKAWEFETTNGPARVLDGRIYMHGVTPNGPMITDVII